MSAARPIKITGPLTRVMKRNNGDSKVNIIFSFFSPRLTCFALLLLPAWGTLLKRPPVVLLLDDIYTILHFFFPFFFPSGGYQLMSSKCPPTNSSAGVEDCFAEEVKGVTKSHRWPWTSVINVKCERGTQQGLLYIWFYWPPCRAICGEKTCNAHKPL